MKKITITMLDDDYSMLEEIRKDKRNRRTKSQQIGWLVKQEYERLQDEKQNKPLPDNAKPCDNPRIIQFPVMSFLGSS